MLLLKWICAHLMGDFLLQSSAMVRHKKRLKARSWVICGIAKQKRKPGVKKQSIF